MKHRQRACFALQGCVFLSETNVKAALPLCHLMWLFMLNSWSSFQICRRSMLKQCIVQSTDCYIAVLTCGNSKQTNIKAEIYVHVTVHRNKFLYIKTN